MDMIEIATEIQEFLLRSLQDKHIQRGKIDVPEDKYIYVPNSVSAGNIGSCPRQREMSRRKLTPTFPELAFENNQRGILSMSDGVEGERWMLEGLYWGFKHGLSEHMGGIMSQYDARSQEHALHGKADAVIGWRGGRYVLEMKTSKWSIFQPKYVYQLMTYLLGVKNAAGGIIVIKSGYEINMYPLLPEGEGFKVWDISKNDWWKNPYNDPKFFNYDRLFEIADQVREYRNMGLQELMDSRPISDPVNISDDVMENGDTYWCLNWVKKPGKKVGGLAAANCEYNCWSAFKEVDLVVNVEHREDGSLYLVETEDESEEQEGVNIS